MRFVKTRVVYRHRDIAYAHEKQKYKAEMTKLRKVHFKDYWAKQTQIENEYFEKTKANIEATQRRKAIKWNTVVCRIAGHTMRQIDIETRKQEERLRKIEEF